jgi:hypothetical protein
MDRERVRHESNAGLLTRQHEGENWTKVRHSAMGGCRWEYTRSCQGIRHPKWSYKMEIEGTGGGTTEVDQRGQATWRSLDLIKHETIP